jgi:hypothetical protein
MNLKWKISLCLWLNLIITFASNFNNKMNKDFKGPKRKLILDHKILTKNIAIVIRDVIKEGTNLDKALEKVMRANKKWNFRNRTYIYETCSDMIRYWRCSRCR